MSGLTSLVAGVDTATADEALSQLLLTEDQFLDQWADPPPMWRSSAVDEARIRETLAFLELHPERWDQGTYADTDRGVGCFAGWTVALDRECDIRQVRTALPEAMELPREAMRLLGLTLMQATALFSTASTFDPALDRHRPLTLAEFCHRVELVTGVGFKPATVVEADS